MSKTDMIFLVLANTGDAMRERGSTIERVLAILEEVTNTDHPISASEINQSLQLPRSTAHRLCSVMEEHAFLQRHADGKRYMPGPKLRKIATGVLGHSRHRAEQHAILTSLSNEIGETCNLSHPDGAEMVYAERVETQWPLRLQLPIGSRVPVYCTASGKMYLSSLRKQQRERVLRHLPLVRRTANSLIDCNDLLRELKQIRKRGYSMDNQEYIEGMTALAVPILDDSRRFVGTVSFHAPISRLEAHDLDRYVPKLQRAARELAALTRGDCETSTKGFIN
ncbi:MAG: IclR family transcriptional regulator [Acidiferrobacterales bacterium]|nr:IclR family transcriptional regulator [Acidiferrobacterales bacterium]